MNRVAPEGIRTGRTSWPVSKYTVVEVAAGDELAHSEFVNGLFGSSPGAWTAFKD
jgi:hypothetical protein